MSTRLPQPQHERRRSRAAPLRTAPRASHSAALSNSSLYSIISAIFCSTDVGSCVHTSRERSAVSGAAVRARARARRRRRNSMASATSRRRSAAHRRARALRARSRADADLTQARRAEREHVQRQSKGNGAWTSTPPAHGRLRRASTGSPQQHAVATRRVQEACAHHDEDGHRHQRHDVLAHVVLETRPPRLALLMSSSAPTSARGSGERAARQRGLERV